MRERLADDAWLLRLGDRIDSGCNARVHALAAAIRADAPGWLVDLVPAYASLAVFFDASRDDADAIGAWLDARLPVRGGDVAGSAPRPVEIPVAYGGDGGPDLATAAAELGLSPDALATRHAAGDYTVAMIGFAPGFPYLLGLDPALALPRLATPRTHVPAGSVAIGGAQTGIYPREGPGGWRLLGRTPLRLFDPARDPPALLAPGDRVRFLPREANHAGDPDASPPPEASSMQHGPVSVAAPGATVLDVLAPGLLTTVQDAGRRGWRHLGVGLAGALDPDAAALANGLVGNPPGAAVLEATLQGPMLRLHRPTRIAICGGTVEARFEDAGGHAHAVPAQRPVDLPAGLLHLVAVTSGVRAWIAFAGGIDVPLMLGSRATDLRGGFGGVAGRALKRGDRLVLGDAPAPTPVDVPRATSWWIDPAHDVPAHAPIRFVPADAGDAATVHGLATRAWRVEPRSDRQGLRLAGEALATDGVDRISGPVAPGTIQLPPDGQPIVLLADAQTTGGYPRLGAVVGSDLARLAQARPGDTLRFEPVDAAGARALATAHRARLARLRWAIAARRDGRGP
ncbi:5-oxoprolinase subunit PxpB [Luteimonas pelagia]